MIFTSSAIRRIAIAEPEIFLTFDDGPAKIGTPEVLECLDRHGAKATFFMVAEKARENREMVARVQSAGHAIGNHSLDHRYQAFFAPCAKMKAWIEKSERAFEDIGVATVGFRPPAGVCTPPLAKALGDAQVPLVLWKHRFFDTAFAWSEKRMRKSLPNQSSGDIVLLHDSGVAGSIEAFISTLDTYLREGAARGLSFGALSRDRCLKNGMR